MKINKSLSTQELRIMWDQYQRNYTRYLSKNFLPMYMNMINLSKVENLKNPKILEIGSGSGIGINFLSQQLATNSLIIGTDISRNMLEYSYDSLKNLENLNRISLKFTEKNFECKYNEFDPQNFIENSKEDIPKVVLFDMDAENLKIKENSLDLVISNMTLNIVNNPEKVVEKTHQILKDDGVGVFSIWGRPENSLPFTLIPSTLKKFNVELPQIRSFFHLSKIEKLKILFSKFNKFYSNYMIVNLDFYNFNELDFLMNSPIYYEIFQKIKTDNPKLHEDIFNEMQKQFESVVESGKFFNTETIIVLVKK